MSEAYEHLTNLRALIEATMNDAIIDDQLCGTARDYLGEAFTALDMAVLSQKKMEDS